MFRSPPLIISGRLHFLDVLRGLAALAVMFFHFFAKGVSPLHDQLAASLPAWTSALLANSYVGVDVFFVLSGFVIAFSMDGHATNLKYAGNFIIRRSLRLDPPYWTACALLVGYFVAREPAKWHDFYLMYSGWQGIAANMFYVQNLQFPYPARSILDVSWTLCLEIQFYLSFLLMLMAGHYAGSPNRAGNVRVLVIGLLLTAVILSSIASWVLVANDNYIGRAWMFFIGVAIYGALTRGAPRVVVAAFLTTLTLLCVQQRDIEGIVAVTTASLIFVTGATNRLSTFMARPALLYFGKISYSLYLLHLVIGGSFLNLLPAPIGSTLQAWIAFFVAIILSIAGAALLHVAVEAPSNRLSRRFKLQDEEQLTDTIAVDGVLQTAS